MQQLAMPTEATHVPTTVVRDPIVEIRGISKIYGSTVTALQDINLKFERGHLTSLLGPSGCGKTTLLKIVAGLLQPTSGQILVNGKPVTGPGRERAFVFQDFALMPWATVLENAAFGLKMQGVARSLREDRARHYIAEVGLSGFEQKYPHELSGGMRQRVGLARALAVNADILLMDEPFSAVDEQTRRKFQEDLMRLREVENKTFLFVTHSIEEAVYVSDRIVMLSPRPGRVSEIIDPQIRADITPDELRRDEAYLDTVERIWTGIKKYVE
ncbi:ABC transporter ATP-binding protein [Paracoccus sp. 1_MG-2023]|uniref:ABC transporter ATP-binding protein n=1 Tax=unclassified Paracoccus (in: a-proteobacteria) TaxID=2688777 RepID=UPI001C08FB76|nr:MULTISPECIES: ABC transporter ATP-binding protein [unclassified Paracoccus (in: a-proteobacteria)]MBU2957865.1 ABC transporter ATP-binding protein [Paracoccus sp. C2R09]MDO6668943.1 ABC transporter ATP-binding protein [Paracoccus sp. 1_MG-2023]